MKRSKASQRVYVKALGAAVRIVKKEVLETGEALLDARENGTCREAIAWYYSRAACSNILLLLNKRLERERNKLRKMK